MEIFSNLDKNNLHHAYLIEGTREEIVPKIFQFVESLGIKTANNPDFCYISIDSFKIEDARNLKSIEYEKGFSSDKKIYIISANNFLLEAQNTLLKIFEEPIENTHFFIIVPNINILLKTLISRFYLIKTKTLFKNELEEAEKFIKMSIKNRIDFIKELLTEIEQDEENLTIEISSTRSKALKFLNALETILHNKFLKNKNSSLKTCFEHIFKIKEFVNQPGASLKTLMESVALIVPSF